MEVQSKVDQLSSGADGIAQLLDLALQPQRSMVEELMSELAELTPESKNKVTFLPVHHLLTLTLELCLSAPASCQQSVCHKFMIFRCDNMLTIFTHSLRYFGF